MERSGNPALGESVLGRVEVTTAANAMTAKGTYAKTAVLLMIVIISGMFTASWLQSAIAAGTVPSPWLFFWLPAIISFVLAMTMSFNPRRAKVLALPYALLQGIYLGVLSAIFATAYDGIVGAAVLVTFTVFTAVLVGYRTGLLKATARFRRILLTALLGIGVYYLFSWVFALFGLTMPLIASYSTWGIAFSIFVVLTAALSLVLDFDFIEQAAQRRYPKYFEWYGAFGLIVGLIWLYVEILRLLAKIMSRQGR